MGACAPCTPPGFPWTKQVIITTVFQVFQCSYVLTSANIAVRNDFNMYTCIMGLARGGGALTPCAPPGSASVTGDGVHPASAKNALTYLELNFREQQLLYIYCLIQQILVSQMNFLKKLYYIALWLLKYVE